VVVASNGLWDSGLWGLMQSGPVRYATRLKYLEEFIRLNIHYEYGLSIGQRRCLNRPRPSSRSKRVYIS